MPPLRHECKACERSSLTSLLGAHPLSLEGNGSTWGLFLQCEDATSRAVHAFATFQNMRIRTMYSGDDRCGCRYCVYDSRASVHVHQRVRAMRKAEERERQQCYSDDADQRAREQRHSVTLDETQADQHDPQRRQLMA